MTRTARQKRIRAERSESKAIQKRNGCPTMDKQRFVSRGHALKQGMTAFRGVKPFKVYLCKCGGYHITTKT